MKSKNPLNAVKNISVLTDFALSVVASSVKDSNEQLSGILFMVSAVVLLIAVVCVLTELFLGRRNRKNKA